jgi:F0F1-type ATP synthase assembly protein I
MNKENRTNKEEKNTSSWSALGFAWELGYSIVVPLVLFAMGGRYLDKKMGTSPWLLLGGLAISIVLTSIVTYYKVTKEMNKLK